MIPTRAVSCDSDIRRVVSLTDHKVIGGQDVLQSSWECIFGDCGKTVARRNDRTRDRVPRAHSQCTEHHREQVGVLNVCGVPIYIAPSMNEKDDFGVLWCARSGFLAAEGIEEYWYALGFL